MNTGYLRSCGSESSSLLKWCIFRRTQITTGNGNGTFQNSAPGRLRAVGPPQFGVPGRRFRSLQKEPCPRPERLNTNSKQTSTPVGLFGPVGVELRRTVQSTTEPMPHRHLQPLGHAIANNASCFYQLLSHRVEVASTLHPPKWPPRSHPALVIHVRLQHFSRSPLLS